jgi:hypothetical protein
MSKSNITDHKVRDSRYALTEVMRSGIRKGIAQAFEAQVAELGMPSSKRARARGS